MLCDLIFAVSSFLRIYFFPLTIMQTFPVVQAGAADGQSSYYSEGSEGKNWAGSEDFNLDAI